jgi:hypothetical protein
MWPEALREGGRIRQEQRKQQSPIDRRPAGLLRKFRTAVSLWGNLLKCPPLNPRKQHE